MTKQILIEDCRDCPYYENAGMVKMEGYKLYCKDWSIVLEAGMFEDYEQKGIDMLMKLCPLEVVE